MSIRIETGPFPGAPYNNWRFWQMPDEANELEDMLDDADTGVHPFGGFIDCVRDAAHQVTADKKRINLSLAGAGGNENDLDVYVVWVEGEQE